MKYKENDIISIVTNLYEAMAILTIKNIPENIFKQHFRIDLRTINLDKLI